MIRFSRLCAFLVLGLLGVPLGAQTALGQGVVTVSPQLVEFEGRQRATTITLINRGTEPALYRLQLVNRRMSESGQLIEVEEEADGLKFASPYLRYAPRQLRLPPGEPQAVRILARVPGDLPDGEYRSHLLVQQVPSTPEPSGGNEPAEEFSFELVPVFGTTIPIFIRRGDLEARGDLDVEKIDRDADGDPRIHVKIGREGNRHLRGNIRVTGDDGTEVGRANNVAVYTTTPHRIFAFPLNIPEDFDGKTVVVEMVDTDDETVIASTTATLPKD